MRISPRRGRSHRGRGRSRRGRVRAEDAPAEEEDAPAEDEEASAEDEDAEDVLVSGVVVLRGGGKLKIEEDILTPPFGVAGSSFGVDFTREGHK